jgi:hypothetical protein
MASRYRGGVCPDGIERLGVGREHTSGLGLADVRFGGPRRENKRYFQSGGVFRIGGSVRHPNGWQEEFYFQCKLA